VAELVDALASGASVLRDVEVQVLSRVPIRNYPRGWRKPISLCLVHLGVMPHIHTKPGNHDLTTTAFILRRTTKGYVGFLHRHRTLGMLLPVGGHVELSETPWAGVLHEIAEESGYQPSQLEVLQPTDRIQVMSGVKTHPVPLFLQTHEFKSMPGHYHTDIGFAFVTDTLPERQPHAGESQDIEWLSNDEMQLRSHEMPDDIVEIYDFCFHTAVQNWERVAIGQFDA
jgi:8-oxo-dGTP diphosphatase